jgi:2,5-diamino-6-(ribosylamino)-4(3H)-pyrimidinone 5'-phosphate reductase
MLPRVIVYNAVSLDGRIDWFTPDVGLFYGLAATWQEDATLAGSETLLTAEDQTAPEEELAEAPEPQPDDQRPLLVVVDSRARVRHWDYWKRQPYWRGVIVLCSRATPAEYLRLLQEHRIPCIVAGDDHVSLRPALEELNAHYGVQTVRVDSGGTLNGALLRAGLVDEVSVLLHPVLVGGTSPRSFYRAPDLTSAQGLISLKLIHQERLENDVLWLRYQVVKPSEGA